MKNLFKSASCGNPAKFVWQSNAPKPNVDTSTEAPVKYVEKLKKDPDLDDPAMKKTLSVSVLKSIKEMGTEELSELKKIKEFSNKMGDKQTAMKILKIKVMLDGKNNLKKVNKMSAKELINMQILSNKMKKKRLSKVEKDDQEKWQKEFKEFNK